MPKVITKQIYEWADLCKRLQRAIQKGPCPRNDWDRQAIELLKRQPLHRVVTKLTGRLWAVGTQSAVQLHYVRRSRSTGDMAAKLAAVVYPASGGRTQYRIPNNVNGCCANKHLPMNARDRESGTSSRMHWYFGAHGVWRRGVGEHYPDAGPRCCNDSLAEVIEMLRSSDAKPPQAWRERAMRFARSVAKAVRPFGDIVIRYELAGITSAERRGMFVNGYADLAYSTFGVTADYGLRIRLKSPSQGSDPTPDFCAIMSGPLAVIDDGPHTWFAVEMLIPQGNRSHNLAPRSSYQAAWILTLKPSRVLAQAKDWAAANVRIPIS